MIAELRKRVKYKPPRVRMADIRVDDTIRWRRVVIADKGSRREDRGSVNPTPLGGWMGARPV